jgi:DNA-binding response OmpR family regulator
MPGASGIDVYDVVRNQPALEDVPVLFVTANPKLARDTIRGRARREVIAKPFDIDVLVAKVRELLRAEIAAA